MFFFKRERMWRIELRKRDQSQAQMVFETCPLKDLFGVAADAAAELGPEWTVWAIQSIN
jgi:hypothetical protein